MRILIVEDERKVAKALRDGLESESFEVTVTHTGEEGFFLVNEQTFDLVLLDLMLPGRDGFQVLDTLRKRGLDTPVLILPARDSIEDRVTGLRDGKREFGQQIEIRCWDSVDARIATPTAIPFDRLQALAAEILRDVPGVVSVTYNIAPKPPSTIEAV